MIDPGLLIQFYIAGEEGLRPLHLERFPSHDDAYFELEQMNMIKQKYGATFDEEIVFMEVPDA